MLLVYTALNTVQISDNRLLNCKLTNRSTGTDEEQLQSPICISLNLWRYLWGQFIHKVSLHLASTDPDKEKLQFQICINSLFGGTGEANSSMKFTAFSISSNTQLSAFQIHSHKFIQYIFKCLRHTIKENK